MKKLVLFFVLVCFYTAATPIYSQNENYLDRHPIYDYGARTLSSIDSVPGYAQKDEQIKITGTIFEADGKTPAANVTLFVEQPDEHGNFDLRNENKKRYVHHRAWVKTDENGSYTIYTFIPGNDRIHQQYKQLYPVIMEPNKEPYEIETFLFDNDRLISKYCRKRLAKKGDITRILIPKESNGILVAQRDIILPSKNLDTQ